MGAEMAMKVTVVPEFGDLENMIGQLRRTGESLIAAADSLQRLSDGGPDASRTLPAVDSTGQPDPDEAWAGGVCPFMSAGVEHGAHRFQVDTDVSKIGASVLNFDCPGHPVRPWHEDGQPDSYRDYPCPKVSAGRVHLPHMTDSDHGRQKRCPGYSG